MLSQFISDRFKHCLNFGSFLSCDRLRRGTEESIREARERLRQQDLRIIKECRAIVERYRNGEYVSEEDLEYAFKELETRLS